MNDATNLRRAIVVCALGYFIDVFDIQLFGVLRVPSLTEMGVPADRLATIGGYILNAQMIGMVLGAFLWGFLGDRLGRLKALYGSILIYSVGTFACGFVHDPMTYGILRVGTGFGLAGETGAALTLIAEMMPALKRTWGLITVAGIGFLGPVAAILISWVTPWRETYMVAGVLGIIILALRIRLGEPHLFTNLVQKNVLRGSWGLLLQKPQMLTMTKCVLIGLPLTYGWFLLNFFSAEIAHAVLLPEATFNQKVCMIFFFLGTACGDVLSAFASHFWQSRRRTLALFYAIGSIASLATLVVGAKIGLPTWLFYSLYFAIGIAAGAWVVINTMFLENFGTNIRATASIVLINFVRGASIPILVVFQTLRQTLGTTEAAVLIGCVVYTVGFWALKHSRETHGLDLDYVETREPAKP